MENLLTHHAGLAKPKTAGKFSTGVCATGAIVFQKKKLDSKGFQLTGVQDLSWTSKLKFGLLPRYLSEKLYRPLILLLISKKLIN